MFLKTSPPVLRMVVIARGYGFLSDVSENQLVLVAANWPQVASPTCICKTTDAK